MEITQSPTFKLRIQLRQGDLYDYSYLFNIPEISPGKKYETKPRNWTILNRKIITYSIEGTPQNIIFSDVNGKGLIANSFLHQVVPTTPERVYEFWGFMVASVSLLIIALEKLPQFCRFVANIIKLLIMN